MNQFRTRIPKQTEEFGTVEYKLQLGLNLPTLEITKLYSLNNPHLTLSFEQNSSEMMILDSFVDPREIKSPNSIESIFARGFLIDPEEGLSFNVGQLLLEKNTSNQYQLILCKIAIKRPFLTDKTLSKDDIPKDFDCLSLKSDSSQNFLNNSSYFFDSFKKLFFSQDFFSNKFVLFEKSKILPTHFVKFKIDDGQIQNTNKNKPLCDFCEKKPAIIWCQNDQARFCKACDEEYHSSNKLLQRHVRIPISEAEEITEKCFYHSDQNIEFYCPTCKMALCVHCKMVGNHSTGESSTHKLVSIKHAYSNILKTSKKPDPLLLQRKSSISKQTIAVKKRISEIETNGENIKARTREIMNQIISSIDGITEKKLEVLNSDLTNLQRQEKEIDWLLGFLNRQQEIQSPLAFIASWDRHVRLRKEILNSSQIRTNIEVNNDIILDGALKILKKTDNGEYTTEAFLSAETQVKNQFNPEDFQTLKFPSQNTFTKTPNIPTKTSSRLRKSLFRSAGVLFENQKSSGEKKTYHQTPKKRESIVPLTGEPTVQESFGAFDSPILGVQQKSRQKEKVFGLWNSALKKNQQQKNQTQIESTNKFLTPQKPEKQIPHSLKNTMNQVNSQTTFDSPFFPKDGKIQLSPAFDAILKLPRVISMIEEAESREKKLLKMDVEINENPFADSEILSGTGLESVLFLCLPFKTQPETALLYSSSRDGFSIKKMHDFIDNSGPVVFLLKKNEQIFGGFVSTSINCEQKFFGSTKSFLFNLFYDTKIPFIGENSKCIFSSENSIKFGSTDLILQNDFLDCKSEIESCFGVGFEKGSDDAKTFLAGSYQFIPDIVEVFGFVKSN